MEDVVDMGRRDEPVDIVDPDLIRAAMATAESTERRLLLDQPVAPIDDVVEPLLTAGSLIVEGKPSPKILHFFMPSNAFASGLVVSAPASKLLIELRIHCVLFLSSFLLLSFFDFFLVSSFSVDFGFPFFSNSFGNVSSPGPVPFLSWAQLPIRAIERIARNAIEF